MSDPNFLYFFPEQEITAEELKGILSGDDGERRAWAVSNLLRYAQWEDIWDFVTRDEVRDLFPELDLSDSMRQALARMLQIETPVSPVG